MLSSTLLFLQLLPKFIAVTSILPGGAGETCDPGSDGWGKWERAFNDQEALAQGIAQGTSDGFVSIGPDVFEVEELLACAVKTGNIQFWMIPYFIRFAMDFVVQLGGLIVILMIMVGAYYYIAGGVSDDKEKGKKIITYAIGGYVLVLVSWVLVNVILLALTA